MCGICGIASHTIIAPNEKLILEQMNDTMVHRGPDDSGYYIGENAALAMRRLSIIDLATGHQPISNEDDTIWLVFNGEIYNYQTIREELLKRGHQFKTNSDSEVIIHAYEEYGDDCVDHLNGMFGFALWDSARRRLMVARDRVGIKPLYYAHHNGHLVFGSELKSVIQHPFVPRDLDPVALNYFLTLEYIPSPYSIFQHVRKLPPGHRLIFEEGDIRIEKYWDIKHDPVSMGEQEAQEKLAWLIQDAVRLRLISDVPLGAFLSGGLDSSAIVSYMSEASALETQTFSIGFQEATYNELPYARSVAAKYNAVHREEILQPDILDLAYKLVGHLDEPLGDFSIFPTYLVSQMARKNVKVVLSGDGGDELFGGYDTYVAQHYASYYEYMPKVVRQRVLPAILDRVPPQPAKKGPINKAKRFVEGGALPDSLQHTRWMMFMNREDKEDLYSADMLEQVTASPVQGLFEDYFSKASAFDPLAQQQYVDVKTYMADNILTKVDRMSMAASLEARVPLLDHRIVEFGLNLPTHMKLHKGETKLILRRIMQSRLPADVLNKPKEGFSIPIKHWLRGPLKPLMMDLLSPTAIERQKLFNPKTVARWINDHMAGKVNHSHRLWALMVFELWQQSLQPKEKMPV